MLHYLGLEFLIVHVLIGRNIHVDVLQQNRRDDVEIILRVIFPSCLDYVGAIRLPVYIEVRDERFA